MQFGSDCCHLYTMKKDLHGTRVAVAVTNDLVTDQRVHRTCLALHEAGCQVSLFGRMLPESNAVQRPYRCSRMRLLFRKTAFFYAEYNIRLFVKLLCCKFDVFYANDTDTLLACYLASAVKRKPLFFDAHELFTEVPELVNRPKVRSVWRRIEKCILPKVSAAVTVSNGVAKEYASRYGLKMSVVRNLPFRNVQPPSSAENNNVKTILYQGAVNEGRGVAWMIDAMEYLPHCRFLVVGNGDLYDSMVQYANSKAWSDRIEFLGRVEFEKLNQITMQAHLGLILLENKGLNYYYSFPNRVGDYAQACVPVLATDFPELRQVVAQYDLGTLIAEPQRGECYPLTIANAVKATLDQYNWSDVNGRFAHFEKARRDLCWEVEKMQLLDSFRSIMD